MSRQTPTQQLLENFETSSPVRGIAIEVHARPCLRLFTRLECIQEELLSVFAQAQSDDFERSGTGRHGLPMEKCFTGAFLIENLGVVSSRGEGVRIGRALMDAGFLHHFHHGQ